jgi:hypothetical protein
MIKTVNVSDIPLPDGVSIESADWYYSTKADFSDEALPTEEESDDIYEKTFEYDFYEDSILYVKAILNGGDDKEYHTNIIVVTKHYNKMLVNGIVYAPIVSCSLRVDRGGATLNINRPIFYFDSYEHTSTSYQVEDANGNVVYSRMYDKDNLLGITIPIPEAYRRSTLVFSVRYEFQDTIEDVWGRSLKVYVDDSIDVSLDKQFVYRGEDSVLTVLANDNHTGNLIYHLEDMRGVRLTDDMELSDTLFIGATDIAGVKFFNVCIEEKDGVDNGIVKIKIQAKEPRAIYVDEMIKPSVVEVTGTSPDTFSIRAVRESHFLDKNSDDYIDIYKQSDDTVSLVYEDVLYLDKFDNGLFTMYVSDNHVLIGYVNSDDEMKLLYCEYNNSLSLLSDYTVTSDAFVVIYNRTIYYKEGDVVKYIKPYNGESGEIDGDFDAIEDVTHVSPIGETFFVANKNGEFYNSVDSDTQYTYSDSDVDYLRLYPTHTGVVFVYGIKGDSYIAIKYFDNVTQEIETLKEIDGDVDDYMALFDIVSDTIKMMKG